MAPVAIPCRLLQFLGKGVVHNGSTEYAVVRLRSSVDTYESLNGIVGALIGTLVGMLPGLGPTSTIAILLPFSMSLGPTEGIIMLAGIYYGAMYGGSTTAILLNIPGEVSSIPTSLDGYPLAKQGRGGAALGISAIGSFIAGTIGVFGLVFFAPLLADQALKFGPPEYFALTAACADGYR